MLRIRSIPEAGFYRAGMRFTPEGVDVDPKMLTAEQLKAIQAEPMLRVEEVDAGESAAPAVGKSKKAS